MSGQDPADPALGPGDTGIHQNGSRSGSDDVGVDQAKGQDRDPNDFCGGHERLLQTP